MKNISNEKAKLKKIILAKASESMNAAVTAGLLANKWEKNKSKE